MRPRSGMTLLELVIAIVILAMLVTGGAAAFGMVIDQQQTIRAASADVERAAALRETLRQWILQGAVQVPQGGLPQGRSARTGGRTLAAMAGNGASTGVTAAASTNSANEFTVVTSAPSPIMSANVCIRVFVDADNSTPEQGLTIEYQANTNTPLMRRELDPSIGDLSVEYYDQRTGRWGTSAEASPAQAIAIRVTLLPADGAVLPSLLTTPLTIVYGEVTP